jgi:gluconolactonase
MAIVANSPKLHDLIDPGAQVEQIVSGCTFTEGPLWNAAGGFFLFSDVPESRRRKWSEAGGVEVVRDPNSNGNGMTYDAQGNLIVCEHATSSVVRENLDGSRDTLASHWQGKELNSPNDVVVAPDGSIFFTDPSYGRLAAFGVERDCELDFCGTFRITPGGELQLVASDFGMPNGLCFSVDGSLLYVNDTERAHIRVFPVGADGSTGAGRMFAEGIGTGSFETGLVDGMKCDERGNIWVTGPKGVWVLAADGEHLGVVEIPEHTGNLTFGGPDWKTLIVAASKGVYRVPTRVAAHREPYMA